MGEGRRAGFPSGVKAGRIRGGTTLESAAMLFDRKPKTAADASAGDDGPEVKRRRDRMAGLWAAELLGLIGKTAHDYAHEVAHAHEQTEDDEHVVGRLAKDLHGKVTAHEIREKLAHFVAEARRQLLHEGKRPAEDEALGDKPDETRDAD